MMCGKFSLIGRRWPPAATCNIRTPTPSSHTTGTRGSYPTHRPGPQQPHTAIPRAPTTQIRNKSNFEFLLHGEMAWAGAGGCGPAVGKEVREPVRKHVGEQLHGEDGGEACVEVVQQPLRRRERAVGVDQALHLQLRLHHRSAEILPPLGAHARFIVVILIHPFDTLCPLLMGCLPC